jgi:hypothetical protein
MRSKMTKRKILWPIFSLLIVLSIVLTIISFLFTRSSFVKVKVEDIFRNIIESTFTVKVKIGKTEGDLLNGYTFHDISLISQDSIQIGRADFISIDFNILDVVKKQKKIERIILNEPELDLTEVDLSSLIKKKEEGEGEEIPAEKDETGGIRFKDISIINGNISIKNNERKHSITNLNVDGTVYISPNKNTIILKKCNGDLPHITEIEKMDGTIILRKGIVSLLNCSVKTSSSSLTIDGHLFDPENEISLSINNLSLYELSHIVLPTHIDLKGNLKGRVNLKGKREDLEMWGAIETSDVIFNSDSLGEIQCTGALRQNLITLHETYWKSTYGEVSLSGSYNLGDKSFNLESQVLDFIPNVIIRSIFKKDWDAKLSGEITAKGSHIMDPKKREIELYAKLNNSHIENLSIDKLIGEVSYADRNLLIEKAELYSDISRVSLKGSWGEKKQLQIESENLHLSPLLELAGISGIDGFVTIDGFFEEKDGKRYVKANLTCNNPVFKNIKGNYLKADINYNIAEKNTFIMIKGIELLNTHLDSLLLTIETDTTINGFSFFTCGENLTVYSSADVSKQNEDLYFSIDTMNITYKKAKVINKETILLKVGKEGVELRSGQVLLAEIPILLSLDIEKNLNYSVSMESDSLDLRTISELLKFNKDLGGILDINISGKGSLRNPRLSLTAKIDNFFLEQMRAEEITAQVSYFNEEIRFESLKILKRDEISEAKGTIPLTIFRKEKDENRKIEFAIIANNLGDWIFYPFDKHCHFEGGKVYGTIKGSGTVGKIDIKGDLRIYSTNLYIPFLGIRTKDTEGYITLEGEKVDIHYIKGIVEDGNISLKGNLNLHGIKPESITLSIKGSHIPITGFKDLYITISPNMGLKGPFSKLLLDGEVKIEKGDITIPFRRKREKGIRRGNFSYDLEISAEEGNIWLKNEDADVELAGKVWAKGTGNVPQLSGTFETKRGYFFYLDQTFTIERGIFQFMNSPELNPEIDLRAETKVRYQYYPEDESKPRDTTAMVYLNVGGTMQEPEFTLSSSNPEFTEDKIIILLTLGVTSIEDITSISNVSTLSNKAASYWIRQTLLQEFQSSLGIDAIDLETKLFGTQKTAKLTVGKYISKNLYLGVTHDIFASSKDEFEIEYKVWKGSYLIGERKEDGRYNIGVRFKFKY